MAPSKRSKASFSAETTPMCRKCLSADGTLEPVTSDERGEYLLQQTFSCTNVQMKLLPEFPTYLCSACKSRFDFLDKLRSIWILNNAKIERLKEEVDTAHLPGSETTAEHSDADMQQIGGVGSVVKTEVVAEDSEEDYQSSQTVSNLQQIIYDYNHHDDLFEAEEESLETLLKREPMDDQQQPQPSDAELKHQNNIPKTDPFDVEGKGFVAGRTFTIPDDPASISSQNNLSIKHAIEGRKLNQMNTNGEEESDHTGNHPVSASGEAVIGERRLLRSSKRRSSQKDIAAAAFSVSTTKGPKVSRNVHRNMQKHQCPHCSATYPDTFKLKIHIRTHTGEKPFMCEVCSKTFHAALNLRLHMQIHDKDHQCPHCPAKFTWQSNLKDHIRTHTGEKPFMCEVCSKTFHSAKNLSQHMQIHNKNQRQCPHCPGKFAFQSKLKDHIRTHTGEKPFICKVCGKAFHGSRHLSQHMQIHNKDKYQCPHCSKKFALRSYLNDHVRTHTGEKPFLCKVCNKAFHTADYLRKHMKIHQPYDQHQCPHCSAKFAIQSRLKDHIRTHTSEKPFLCKICSKAFHAAKNLRIHMKIHDKDQHQCPHCSAKFAIQSRLKDHIRTHTGEKPFMCKICSKTFHAANSLFKHMLIHKGQHQCPHCSKKFAQQYKLKIHIRLHTGETPFPCKVCGQKFRAKHYLDKHVKVHNKDLRQTVKHQQPE